MTKREKEMVEKICARLVDLENEDEYYAKRASKYLWAYKDILETFGYEFEYTIIDYKPIKTWYNVGDITYIYTLKVTKGKKSIFNEEIDPEEVTYDSETFWKYYDKCNKKGVA